MGIRGERRTKKSVDKTMLLGNIKDIIEKAKAAGHIDEKKIDIEEIIKEKQIKLVRESLPNATSGYLKKVGDQWIIGINENHSRRRQRFTMAHEFAHFCLHRNDEELFEDETFFRNSDRNSMEYYANHFAAELLMPEEYFKEAIKEGFTKTSQLAEVFDVSSLAIQYRAQSLHLVTKNGE